MVKLIFATNKSVGVSFCSIVFMRPKFTHNIKTETWGTWRKTIPVKGEPK